MEEILASIRKIISEDSSEPQPAQPQAAPAPAQAPPPAAKAAPEAEVLELTQIVDPEPVVAAAPPAPPAPEPVRPADDIVFEEIEEEVEKTSEEHPASNDFVSDSAREAVDDALAGLDFDADEPVSYSAPVAPINGHAVEAVFERAIRDAFDPVLRDWLNEQTAVIVERMKPTIREWMDDNFPAMLKAAVEAEVARAVRGRRKR